MWKSLLSGKTRVKRHGIVRRAYRTRLGTIRTHPLSGKMRVAGEQGAAWSRQRRLVCEPCTRELPVESKQIRT